MSLLYALIISVAIYIGALWIGWRCLSFLNKTSPPPIPMATLLGWSTLSLLILLVGCAVGVSPTLFSIPLLLTLTGILLDRKAFHLYLKNEWVTIRAILHSPASGGLLFILLLFYAYLLQTPPFILDNLYYHYGLPQFWILQEKILPVFDPFALTPLPTRMHFLLGLTLAGHLGPSLTIFMNLLLACLMMGTILYRDFNMDSEWPLIGIMAMLITPAMVDFQLMHMLDATVVWASAVYLHTLCQTLHKKVPSPGDGFVVGLFAGILITSKAGTTAGFVLITGLFIAFLLIKRSRGFTPVITMMAAGLLVLVPWSLWTLYAGGHLLAAGVPYLGTASIRSTRWFGTIHQASFSFRVRSLPLLRDFLYHLQQFFFPLSRFNQIGGQPGLFISLLLPAALLLKNDRILKALWVLGFFSWYLTFRLTRFSAFLLPIEIGLIVLCLKRFVSRRRAIGMLMVLALFNGLLLFKEPARSAAILDTVNEWAGRPIIRGKKDRYLPPTPMLCEIINQQLDPQQHRLLFVGDYRYYPCHIPFLYISYFFRHPIEAIRSHPAPEQQWRELIRQHRITHIIFSPQGARKWFEWSPRLHRRFEQWLKHHMHRLAFVKNRVYKVELYAVPASFTGDEGLSHRDPSLLPQRVNRSFDNPKVEQHEHRLRN